MSVSVKPIAVLPVSMDTEAPTLLSLADYVALTAPNDFQAADANYETDAFKIRTTAGTCLEFYNGRLYMAINNFVYCTKAHDIEHYDIRYNVVAGFSAPVKMIARVEGGLFVATGSDTYFLAGAGPFEKDTPGSGFEQRHVMKYGAIYGTAARVQADNVPDAQAKDTTVLWASSVGVVAGTSNGNYKLLSQNKVVFPEGVTGTAIVHKKDEYHQYIVCFNVGGEHFSDSLFGMMLNSETLLDTWVVNIYNGYHSRYTNFAFNSFYNFGGVCYGANLIGTHAFSGETDSAGEAGVVEQQIEAAITYPTTDFTVRELKRGDAAYASVRGAGDMVLDVTVDETTTCADLPFVKRGGSGVHVRKATLPRGLKGSAWRFKVKNVDGGDFKLFNLEVAMNTSTRSI